MHGTQQTPLYFIIMRLNLKLVLILLCLAVFLITLTFWSHCGDLSIARGFIPKWEHRSYNTGKKSWIIRWHAGIVWKFFDSFSGKTTNHVSSRLCHQSGVQYRVFARRRRSLCALFVSARLFRSVRIAESSRQGSAALRLGAQQCQSELSEGNVRSTGDFYVFWKLQCWGECSPFIHRRMKTIDFILWALNRSEIVSNA